MEFSLVLPILFPDSHRHLRAGDGLQVIPHRCVHRTRRCPFVCFLRARDINADCTTVTSLAAQMGTQELARLDPNRDLQSLVLAGTQSPSTTNTLRELVGCKPPQLCRLTGPQTIDSLAINLATDQCQHERYTSSRRDRCPNRAHPPMDQPVPAFQWKRLGQREQHRQDGTGGLLMRLRFEKRKDRKERAGRALVWVAGMLVALLECQPSPSTSDGSISTPHASKRPPIRRPSRRGQPSVLSCPGRRRCAGSRRRQPVPIGNPVTNYFSSPLCRWQPVRGHARGQRRHLLLEGPWHQRLSVSREATAQYVPLQSRWAAPLHASASAPPAS